MEFEKCEKQSVRLHTVGQQHRAAEVRKTNRQFHVFSLLAPRDEPDPSTPFGILHATVFVVFTSIG